MKHPNHYDTDEATSRRMGNVKLKKGKAETVLAKALWQTGLRYRLNYKKLPGSPDIAIQKYQIAVFVDGEFWHGQDWENRKQKLKRNREYWIEKIEENIARDKRVDGELVSLGWQPVRFWEKEVKKDLQGCVNRISDIIHRNDEELQRKIIEVVAAVIKVDNRIFATQRGYGEYKDGWEFPGGKMEEGEAPEQALIREIKEELETDISVDQYISTIEYDYPKFHLKMYCFLCSIVSGDLVLIEHEAARWLTKNTIDDVDWLPADTLILDDIKDLMGWNE